MAAPKGNTYAEKKAKVQRQDLPKLGKELLDFFIEKYKTLSEHKKPVFMSDFCIEKGYDLTAVNLSKYAVKGKSQWHNKYFKYYTKARKIQEQIFVTGAMKGWFNPTAFIFYAKNRLGFKDEYVNTNSLTLEQRLKNAAIEENNTNTKDEPRGINETKRNKKAELGADTLADSE